jgi:epstein-barr nuclear antigen 1
MGLTVDELKKINALSLDDHTDDTNLDKIRSELVSCDDSIRLIAKSPALTGETQDAVTQALAQLQAEVRKWHGLVASVHSQRTEARDAMRTAKPKFDALPATTGDQVHQGAPLRVEYQTDVDPDPVVEAQRESAASEAITPMDATLTTTTIGLNVLDFTRPAFDPNRAVDQTPLPTTTLNGDAGGDGASAGASAGGGAGASAEASAGGYAGASGSGGATGYAGGTAAAGGYGASSADGSGATASYDGSSGGSGSPAGLITPGAQAAGSVSGITDAAGHYGSAMNGHSAGTLDGLIRNGFVSNTSSASATPIIAGTTGGAFLARKSRGKGAGSGLKGAGGLLAGLAGLAGITRATGAAMGSASAYTTAQAASGAAGLANAGSASSALGVNGTTGVGASAAGAAGSSQGSGAGSSAAGAAGRGAGGMGGRPMGGAPGSGGANGSRRRRKRARGTYDVPVFDEPERLLPGDPGPSGEAGSRATIGAIREWVEESDTW